MFLSGTLTHGVDRLPRWAQAISYLLPLRHANDIGQGAIANQPLAEQLGALLTLLVCGVLLLGLATLTVREYD